MSSEYLYLCDMFQIQISIYRRSADPNILKTSTAEPTASGILWTYIKEMEQYNALWEKSQKIIFDLGNIVDSTYTGPYYTTLTATFFTIPDSRPTADTILPISAEQSAENMGSAFSVPAQNASVSYTLPQNVQRAVISLSACGQIAEEFWYTNTFNSEINTFEGTAGTLYGFSPFRELSFPTKCFSFHHVLGSGDLSRSLGYLF